MNKIENTKAIFNQFAKNHLERKEYDNSKKELITNLIL